MSKYVYIVSSRESGMLGVYSSKQKAIDTLKNYMYHENLVPRLSPVNWEDNLIQICTVSNLVNIDCKNKDSNLPDEYLVIERNIVW